MAGDIELMQSMGPQRLERWLRGPVQPLVQLINGQLSALRCPATSVRSTSAKLTGLSLEAAVTDESTTTLIPRMLVPPPDESNIVIGNEVPKERFVTVETPLMFNQTIMTASKACKGSEFQGQAAIHFWVGR